MESGKESLGLYPLSVVYLVVFGEVSFFLPGYAQGVYWFFVATGLYFVLLSVVEAAFGRKGLLKGTVANWLRSIVALVREAWSAASDGVEAIAERLKNRRRAGGET